MLIFVLCVVFVFIWILTLLACYDDEKKQFKLLKQANDNCQILEETVKKLHEKLAARPDCSADELLKENLKKAQDKCHAYEQKIIGLVGEHQKEIRAARADSNVSQRAIIKGHLAEEICPFLPDFKYGIGDLRMINRPVDFLVFRGMTNDKIEEIVFLEIKSGGSMLTEREKQIRDCIEKGRVSWDLYRIE